MKILLKFMFPLQSISTNEQQTALGQDVRSQLMKGHLTLKVARGQMPVAHVSQKAEIRKIMVRSQPRQTVHKTLSRKNLIQKGLVEWLEV
jgi:hypothetical protein